MGMVTAPILIGGAAQQLISGDHHHYAEQLTRIVEHLTEHPERSTATRRQPH